jgi:hypothetical protein
VLLPNSRIAFDEPFRVTSLALPGEKVVPTGDPVTTNRLLITSRAGELRHLGPGGMTTNHPGMLTRCCDPVDPSEKTSLQALQLGRRSRCWLEKPWPPARNPIEVVIPESDATDGLSR